MTDLSVAKKLVAYKPKNKVRFVTAAALVHELMEARDERRLRARQDARWVRRFWREPFTEVLAEDPHNRTVREYLARALYHRASLKPAEAELRSEQRERHGGGAVRALAVARALGSRPPGARGPGARGLRAGSRCFGGGSQRAGPVVPGRAGSHPRRVARVAGTGWFGDQRLPSRPGWPNEIGAP